MNLDSSGADGELVRDLIFGPMVYRLMAGHGPLDDTQAVAIIEIIFKGLGKNRSGK